MSSPLQPTLLVVAVHAEFMPLMTKLQHRRWHSRRLVEGVMAERPVLLLRTGIGRWRAQRRTWATLAEHPAARVVSMGTCGALVDDLRVGELVTAHAILGVDDDRVEPMTAALRPVVLATVPRVVDDAAYRQHWADQGAEVCEMEALGVLEAAEGRPFTTLKVVSDLAGARPPRVRGVPRALRISAFQTRALELMQRRLAPALEAWLRSVEP